MSIIDFLEARIREDESHAWSEMGTEYFVEGAWPEECVARVLAECAAKRAVIQSYRSCQHAEGEARKSMSNDTQAFGVKLVSSGMVKGMELAVQHIAAAYDDHPDYDPEWA